MTNSPAARFFGTTAVQKADELTTEHKYPAEHRATLMGRRKIETVRVMVETEPIAPVVAPMLQAGLATNFPQLKAASNGIWVGGKGTLTFKSPVLTYVANLTGEHATKLPLAIEHGEKQLRTLHGVASKFAEVRFAAIVITSDFSAKDLPPVGTLVASYVKWPTDVDLSDGEWRVAHRVENRYFVNIGLQTYASRNIVLDPAGPEEGSGKISASLGKLVDQGLRIVVDVNTKVNVHDDLGPITVSDADVSRLVALLTEHASKSLQTLAEG